MKRFSMLLIAIVLSAAAVTASAQKSGKIYIPFAFTANHQRMNAGSYQVQLLSDRYMALVDDKTGTTRTILMVQPDIATVPSQRSGLVFYFSGFRYYLKEVKFQGSSMRSQLAVQPKVERQVAEKAVKSTVEIAMQ